MGLLHLLYATAAYIIWDCCIYYMRLLHILYGTACIYYMRLLHLLYDAAAYNYYMRLLHLLYATAAFIICECCIYIYQVHIQMYVLHLYMQPLHLLYAHAAFTYGAPAYHIMYHLHLYIYVFIYNVRAICINFDTNGTP